eukprot:gene12207-14292_t
MTFSAATLLAKGLSNSAMSAYLLTVEKQNELTLLNNTLNGAAGKTVWLGAQRNDEMTWSWIGGQTQGQVFYDTLNDRCYRFCGNFAATNHVIIEYSPADEVLVSLNSNYENTMTFSNLKVQPTKITFKRPDISPASFNCPVDLDQPGAQRNIWTCTFPVVPVIIDQFDINIESAGSPTITISGYTFSSPHIMSLSMGSNLQVTISGVNFDSVTMLSDPGNGQAHQAMYINNIQIAACPYERKPTFPATIVCSMTSAPPGALRDVGILSPLNNFGYGLIIQTRVAIFSPNALFYTYIPFPVKYTDAVRIAGMLNLHGSDRGTVAFINSEALGQVVIDTLVGSATIWSGVQSSPTNPLLLEYHGKPANTSGVTFPDPSLYPGLYTYNTLAKTYASGATNQQSFQFLVVYGVLDPIVNASFQIPFVQPNSIQNGFSFSMVSNYGFFDKSLKYKVGPAGVYTQIGINRLTGFISFQTQTSYKPTTTFNIIIEQTPTDLALYPVLTRTIALNPNYDAPTITSISTRTDLDRSLTILGTNFFSSSTIADDKLLISGLNCSVVNWLDIGRATCDFGSPETLPDKDSYSVTMRVLGKFVGFNWVSSQPVVTSITPASFNPQMGGLATINGVRLPQQDGLLAEDTKVLFGSVLCSNANASSTEYKCTIPPQTSMNPSLSLANLIDTKIIFTGFTPLDIEAANPNSITIIYDPIITSITLTADAIFIDCANFGNNANLISVLNLTPLPIKPFIGNTGNLQINLTSELKKIIRSGSVYITVNSIQSNTFKFKLVPTIQNVTPLPVAGGLITITGEYVNAYSYTGESLYNVTVDGKPCTSVADLPSGSGITCNAPSGSGTGFSVDLIVEGSTEASYETNYQGPYIQGVTSTLFGQEGVVTVSGNSYAPTVTTVSIGGETCTIIGVSFTSITCQFSSTVAPKTGETCLPVEVKVSFQTYTSCSFIYLAPAKKECTNNCHGGDQGMCVNGQCQCRPEWNGALDCGVKVVQSTPKDPDPIKIVPPVVNATAPEATVGSGSETGDKSKSVLFDVGITHIREINASGDVTQSPLTLSMSDIKWNNVTQSGDTMTYVGSFASTAGLVVTVNVTSFNTTTQHNFVGDNFEVLANSIKYVIQVSNWPFARSINSLQVIFLTQTTQVTDPECEPKIVSSDDHQSSADNSSIRFIQVTKGSTALRGRFSDRLVVDSRIAYSKVRNLDATDPIAKQLSSITSKVNILTCITSPSFIKDLIIDPNFSSLLVDRGETANKCDKNNWLIPVIVVSSVIGAALIILGVIFIRKRLGYRTKLISLKMSHLVSRKNKR